MERFARTRRRSICRAAETAQSAGTKAAAAPPAGDAVPSLAGNVERVEAGGQVVIEQPGRRAVGEHLVYTASDRLFVLTGDGKTLPRLVDSARGTITGAALLFHAGDDSVEVSNVAPGRDGRGYGPAGAERDTRGQRCDDGEGEIGSTMRTLETEEIGKAYAGRQVVRGVNMQIGQGEVVGLLGPNGAGKTTCFYMIVGLVRPDAGCIVADGDDITRLPMYLRAREYGISYLPQEPSIFRKLTVEDNILAVLEAQPLSREERRTRTEKLIEQFSLGHVRKTMGYALSGGERRRVEIARCLAIEPAFILLDEPFSGIDPIAVLELQEIIFGLKKNGIGVLVTDHNVRETLSVTDRAYIINEGKIFRSGTPGELGRDPEVRRIYLGEKFSME